MKRVFFKEELVEILGPPKGKNFPEELVQAALRFSEDCRGGGDGEMDLGFQEQGRGYYAHLHELEYLRRTDQKRFESYLRTLRQEIATTENGMIDKHQLDIVKEQLGQYPDET